MAPAGPRDLRRAQRCFRARGDATRLRRVALWRGGEQRVCDLTHALGTGQSRRSFHLRALEDAGIVTDRRQGRRICYG